MRDETAKWLAIAEDDFAAARDLLATGHFGHVAVSCQQSLEKTVKGLLVEKTGELPPRTHDLLRLARLLGLDLSADHEQLLADLTALYLGVRYPDMGAPALAEHEAAGLMAATGEVRQWLLSRLDCAK